MNYKIVWIAIGLLFMVSVFNAYNSYLLAGEVHALSERFDVVSSHVVTGDRSAQPSTGLLTSERTIPIVAVSNNGDGVIGNLTVKLIPGNNNVLINTNPFLDTDIQYSANKAAAVAKLSTSYGFDRDFLFDYRAGNVQLIGGESAGAATAIATIAALTNETLRKDTVITGTIESDGTIGEVGGVLEKAKAVSDAGYKRFLVPEGQSKVTYYERQLSEKPTRFGFTILNTRYVSKTIDLKETAKKEWNLEIIEVSTIDDALENMVKVK